LANTAIPVKAGLSDIITQSCSIGIFIGLVVGKPLGIVTFSFIATKLGFCSRLRFLKWKQIIGISFLAGIGFTMSIFIANLAFNDLEIINTAKLAILISSSIAAIIGLIALLFLTKKWKP
jgi:NhaA family Na+:H+ antiporter